MTDDWDTVDFNVLKEFLHDFLMLMTQNQVNNLNFAELLWEFLMQKLIYLL